MENVDATEIVQDIEPAENDLVESVKSVYKIPECSYCYELMHPYENSQANQKGYKRIPNTTFKMPQGALTVRDLTVLPAPDVPKAETPSSAKAKLKAKVDSQKHSTRMSGVSFKLGPSKWSGWIYMEEIAERKIERKYAAGLEKALKARKLWRGFQRKLKKRLVQMKTSSAGPDWFQDLSFNQMHVIDVLDDAIDADVEESSCFRTQHLLTELGVTPPIPPKLLRKCLKECDLDRIRFLFSVHKVVVDLEAEEYEIKYLEAQKAERTISAFSLNERLLLSGVFHAHFPHFLKKLDKILPPSPPKPEVRWAAKPIKPKKTYPSPYLEPLPFNEKCWYEVRAEEELFKSLKSKIMQQRKKIKQERLQRLQEEKQKREMNQDGGSVKCSCDENGVDGNESVFDDMSSYFEKGSQLSVTSPIQTENGLSPTDESAEGIGKRRVTFEEELEEEPDEDPCDMIPPAWADFMGITSVSELVEFEKPAPENFAKILVKNETSQTKSPRGGFFLEDLRPIMDSEGISDPSLVWMMPKTAEPEEDTEPYLIRPARDVKPCRSIGVQTNWIHDFHPLALAELYAPEMKPRGSTEEMETDGGIQESERASLEREPARTEGSPAKKKQLVSKPAGKTKAKPKTRLAPVEEVDHDKPEEEDCQYSKKPFNVECTDDTCELLGPDEVPIDEFELVRRQISYLPEDKQLEVAVKYLCDRGDPLAILPSMENTPWLVRWFEKRRGIKVTLTAADKDELMQKSLAMWESESAKVSSIPLPQFDLPNEYLNKLSWDDKEVIEKKVEEKVHKFHREVKQLLVGNARDLYISFFTEYFNSPLTKSFRKTFFTYLPSREADALVFKPWRPAEKKEPTQEDE